MGEIFLQKKLDPYGNPLHILWVDNGRLKFSLILERGFDVGQIFLDGQLMSWERNEKYLLSDKSVDLNVEGGWEMGFYCAVATLGPQLFGTPDEIRTVHGTGAYSAFNISSLKLAVPQKIVIDSSITSVDQTNTSQINTSQIIISAEGLIKPFNPGDKPEYKKKVTYVTDINSTSFIRWEETTNLTDDTLPIDDGYHMQLAGPFMKDGGRYVLPVKAKDMLLRDSAPKEDNPKATYSYGKPLDPIRCYQYVPGEVDMASLMEIEACKVQKNNASITCEMLVNNSLDTAVVVTRPLDVFPRSLLAKRNIFDERGKSTDPMYAIEVCKTRPNSIRQKAIDGELMYLQAHESMKTWVEVKYIKGDKVLIKDLIERIEGK